MRTIAAICLMLVLSSGCSAAGSTSNNAPSPSPTTSPTVASPSPSPSNGALTLIKGTGACQVTSFKEQVVAGNDVILEHFSCQNVMNDPRVNGPMEADFTTTFEPNGATAAHWVGSLTITNPGGSWHGQGHGAVVMAPDGSPTNYGVDVYDGTGGYAGLVYHEFIAGGDASADLTGWIEPR
ncbi:MAG: hypothetical protein ACXWMU_05250 [Candidatus Limnocylindrales bacterium]